MYAVCNLVQRSSIANRLRLNYVSTTIPSVVGQGGRMVLLALSIVMRGGQNVNKRLFRPIEVVLSSN
jgi:hypothetical protein